MQEELQESTLTTRGIEHILETQDNENKRK